MKELNVMSLVLFALGILLPLLGSVVGNILFYRHKRIREKKDKKLKEVMTKFLLPLYINFLKDEFEEEWNLFSEDGFLEDFYSRLVDRTSEIKKIIEENIYLVDTNLHSKSLGFMKWLYLNDKDTLFQKIMNRSFNEKKEYISLLGPYKAFKEDISRKYFEVRSKLE